MATVGVWHEGKLIKKKQSKATEGRRGEQSGPTRKRSRSATPPGKGGRLSGQGPGGHNPATATPPRKGGRLSVPGEESSANRRKTSQTATPPSKGGRLSVREGLSDTTKRKRKKGDSSEKRLAAATPAVKGGRLPVEEPRDHKLGTATSSKVDDRLSVAGWVSFTKNGEQSPSASPPGNGMCLSGAGMDEDMLHKKPTKTSKPPFVEESLTALLNNPLESPVVDGLLSDDGSLESLAKEYKRESVASSARRMPGFDEEKLSLSGDESFYDAQTKLEDLETKPRLGDDKLSRYVPSHLVISEDRTVQNPKNPIPGWRLICYNEFEGLTKAAKCTDSVRFRMTSVANHEQIAREMQRVRDLRALMAKEAKTSIQSLMLDEAKRLFPKIGKGVPFSWEDIRTNWKRDPSVGNARVTWHLLYGLFDKMNMRNRRGPHWEKKLESVLMTKHKIAYISNTIPAGNPDGGPRESGCIRLVITEQKGDLIKKVQQAGVRQHHYWIGVRLPKWATRSDLQCLPERTLGKMEPYMYCHVGTQVFPLLDESKDRKMKAGTAVLEPSEDSREAFLVKRIKQMEEEMEALKQNDRKMKSKVESSLLALDEKEASKNKEKSTALLKEVSKKTKKLERKGKAKKKSTKVDDGAVNESSSSNQKTKKKKKTSGRIMEADSTKDPKRKKSSKSEETSGNNAEKSDTSNKQDNSNIVLDAVQAEILPLGEAGDEEDCVEAVLQEKPEEPCWQLEDDEVNDDITFQDDCDGDAITKLLGSQIDDGKLKVFAMWDDNSKLVSLDDIDPIFEDCGGNLDSFRHMWGDLTLPPRIQKWIAAKEHEIKLENEQKEKEKEEEERRRKEERAQRKEEAKAKALRACCHDDLEGLKVIDNTGYCVPTQYLYRKICNDCDKELVTIVADELKETLFAAKAPAMICPTVEKRLCDFVYCHCCYQQKLLTSPRKRRSCR